MLQDQQRLRFSIFDIKPVLGQDRVKKLYSENCLLFSTNPES